MYVLSLADFFRTASTIGERDGTQVEMILFAGFVYFVISLSASLLVKKCFPGPFHIRPSGIPSDHQPKGTRA